MNEQDLKHALKNMRMDLSLKDRVLSAALFGRKKPAFQRIVRIALCFGAILLLTVGGLRAMWNPAAPSPNNQFSLVAMAADQKESSVKKGSPVSLSLITQTYGYQPMRARLGNGDEEWKYYGILGLKCKGENIDSITYESEKIDFAKIVLLSDKQWDTLFDAYWKVDELNGNFPDMQGTKKPEDIPEEYKVYPDQDWVDPYSNDTADSLEDLYAAFPNAKKYEYYEKNFKGEKEAAVSWCYKTVGKSYTIPYEDQDDFSKQYGYKVGRVVTRKEMAEINRKAEESKKQGMSTRDIDKTYYSNFEDDVLKELDARLDGEILKVTVHFKDGSSQQKRYQLYYDKDKNWELCIKEIG